MKGFGSFAPIVGICWVVFALSLDVSVSTGMGRVNNPGRMADRQVHTIVGGMIALAGLLILIFGGKVLALPISTPGETYTRPWTERQLLTEGDKKEPLRGRGKSGLIIPFLTNSAARTN